MVNLRLRAHFTEADRAAEVMNGISYLLFLRELAKAVERDWPSVLETLQTVRSTLVNRNGMIMNITQDEKDWTGFEARIRDWLEIFPEDHLERSSWNWDALPVNEGLAIPAQVNYVGKGTSLYDLGHGYHGTYHVICRFLRNAWLWDRIRVQGGAYGAFCLFDRLSGIITFVSYRDPNLLKTLEAFDQSVSFLRRVSLDTNTLTKAVIGAIGDIDRYRLPDAAGYTSLLWHLHGETDADRQKVREEVLATTEAHFREFADLLEDVAGHGLIKILGSETAIMDAASQLELKRTSIL
jgi:Zn-dependent M16 (insulinase) family peptidase